MSISKYALSVGAAGLLALSLAPPASAAPRGAAVAAGVGVGLLAGAAIANSQNNYGYYRDPYYAPSYGPTYYGYETAPSYGYYDNGPTYRSSRYYQGRADTNATGNW